MKALGRVFSARRNAAMFGESAGTRRQKRVLAGREDLDAVVFPEIAKKTAPVRAAIQFSCISRTAPASARGRDGVKKLLGKSGDPQGPLRQEALFDDRPDRQPRPSITCSLASTVFSTGSQFTQDSLR